MIHSDTRANDPLAEEAHNAYLTAHPHIRQEGMHNDWAAIEWRHGYITAMRCRLTIRDYQLTQPDYFTSDTSTPCLAGEHHECDKPECACICHEEAAAA